MYLGTLMVKGNERKILLAKNILNKFCDCPAGRV